MKNLAVATFLTLFSSVSLSAVITTNDRNEFNLTKQEFAYDMSRTTSPFTSLSGEITVDQAFGHPNWYGEWSSLLDGYEYVVNDYENINIDFQTDQTAFGIDFVDDSVFSEFSFELLNDGASVGSFAYDSNVYDTKIFLGFYSDVAFDRIQIRERSAQNTNEIFQFYTATHAVPTPATLALFALGLAFMGFKRKTT